MTSKGKMNLKVVVTGYYSKLLLESKLTEDTTSDDVKDNLKKMFQVGKIAARLEQDIYRDEDMIIIDLWKNEIVNTKEVQ